MKRVINGKTYSKVLGIKQGSLLTAGKDGDIEEYKADPTDAGKVLTVGEDGGVAPAESGGSKKYFHAITMPTSFNATTFSCYVVNDSSEKFAKVPELCNWLLANVDNNKTYPCSGACESKCITEFYKDETHINLGGLNGTSYSNSIQMAIEGFNYSLYDIVTEL